MPKTVLIVEDEVLVALDVEATVLGAGYLVLGPAHKESVALDLLQRQKCDIALLDANLGNGGDIVAVAQALQKRCIPFAFVTGYTRQDLPEPFRDVPLLSKPFYPVDLTALLDKLARQ